MDKHSKLNGNKLITLSICFIAGLFMALAFAPYSLYGLSYICLAVLFYYWQTVNSKWAFYTGTAFGLGLFTTGVSWVYVSLHTYGGMPLWMGSIAVVLFAAVLALFIAFQGYLLARLFNTRRSRLLSMPFLWVIFEWIKSWIFTGFPWLELGYSQTPTWLFAWAPVGGVYLVGFMTAAVSALLVLLLSTTHRLYTVTGLLTLVLCSNLVGRIEWSHDHGKALQIAVVQGNIPIEKKWQRGYYQTIIDQYRSLTESYNGADLIIWPETALPLYVQQTDQNFWQTITPKDSALLTGIMDNPKRDELYNSALLSCRTQQQVYRKRHLVPFGEYLPMRFLFNWVLEYLQLPMSDFSAWQQPQTLSCPGNINIGLSICYEDAFANEMQRNVGDATILVNISEDAWFGDSFAPHQRLQMAQMRAYELARPLVRSANTGPSVFINEKGQVQAQTQQFKAQGLMRSVQPKSGQSLFSRFGSWIIYLAFVFVFLQLIYIKYIVRQR